MTVHVDRRTRALEQTNHLPNQITKEAAAMKTRAQLQDDVVHDLAVEVDKLLNSAKAIPDFEQRAAAMRAAMARLIRTLSGSSPATRLAGRKRGAAHDERQTEFEF